MKKHAKKFLAILLTLGLLLGLLPTAALAVDEVAHSHKVCVNTVSHGEGTCAHTDVAYTAWTEADKLPESGNYYLAVDVTLEATSGAALGGDAKKTHITGELNLCLNGHSINYTTDDWNNSSYPDNANGPINVDENGTLNLCDCQNTTHRFKETYSNSIWYWTPAADGEEAKYTVNSGYITGKPYGGLVHVNGGTFHFWSGALLNNKNDSKARGINLEKGTANLYGGQISGHNDAGVSAGEFNISGARTLNCYGTCISDNYIRGVEAWGTAESHAIIHMTAPTKIEGNGLGGVRLYEYADFTMVGGEITGSEGENGALYCNGDNTVTLSGGKITGNIHAFDSSWGHGSSSGAGGIGIEGDDVLTISGDVLLSGNADTGDDSKPCDLHIYNQDPDDYHPIQIAGALTKPAQPAAIYAYKPNDLKTTAFTSGWATHMASANIADYFVSYDPAYTIGKNTDGELVFAPAHTHSLSVDCSTTEGTQVTFTAWDGSDMSGDNGQYGVYLNAGSYYLTDDVTISNPLKINSGDAVDLCLNGHTINISGIVQVYGTLNICDCSQAHSGKINHTGNTNAVVADASGSKVSLYGGTVEGKCGLYANSTGAEVAVYGGTVKGSEYALRTSDQSAVITLYGAPTLEGRTADIFLYYGTLHIGDTLAQPSAAYTVKPQSCTSPAQFTSGWKDHMSRVTDASKYIVSADSGYDVAVDGTTGELKFSQALPAHTHGGVTFTAWTSADSLPDAEGNYYLTTDVTLADTWQTPEDVAVNLCLNGHSVTGPGGKAAVHSVSELTLLNCQERQSVIDGGTGGTAVEARLGSLAFSGSGLIKLAATGRYSCALDIGIQRLGGPTLVATIPNTVTLEVTDQDASSALYVHESTNNKVRVSGAKVFGNSSTGVQVDCGSVEITDGTITGMPALYTHWQGTITVSGGRVSTDTGGHAIEVMGPVSVTGAPTVFGPAVIIYSSFDQGKLDARGYTGSQKISLMIKDTAPAKAAVGDIIVTNGTLSQFELVSSKFSLAADGTNLKLAEKGTAPTTYTVTFNANGHGTAPASITGVAAGSKITAPTPPTAQGWVFGGWYQEAACTTPWVFDTNTVTGNVTLYAKWTEVPSNPTYDISGTVTDESAGGNATVTLMRGSTVISTQEITLEATGAAYYHGNYSFTGVEPGVYNVVARSGDRTKTILVVLTNANAERQNIRIASTKQNSVVEVKGAGTPAVVVGGVDQVAENEHPGAGETVTVKLTVEKKAENAADNAADIKAVAGDQTLDFLELKLEKTVTDGANPDTTTDITDTGSTVIEIVVPFTFTNRQNVTVYRYHGTSAEALTQSDAKTGGTFRLDTANGLIYIYATKFSTYAIGYTAQSTTPTTPSRPSSRPSRPAWPFVDVAEADWCYGGVKYAYENKLMEGTDESHFSPAMDTSRAMVATILWRLAGQPAAKGEAAYPDCEPDAWYAQAVAWGTESGLLKGYGNGSFGPEDPITREQLALMLYRYAQTRGAGGIENGTEILRFADTGDVSDWAKEAMTWAVDKGIVAGKGGDILDPQGGATRAETATVLMRFCEQER